MLTFRTIKKISAKEVIIFSCFILVQRGFYRLLSLLLENYPRNITRRRRTVLREISRKPKKYKNKKTKSKVFSQLGSQKQYFTGANESSFSLAPYHLEELEKSCIDKEIIGLNFKSLSGNTTLEYLLYSAKIPRTNTGRISTGTLRKYSHCLDGGWWVSGVDVIELKDSLWGQFKPDKPRIDQSKGKYIKYEAPPKIPTQIIALKIPVSTWEQIARRYSLPLPDNYKQVDTQPSIFWKWVIDNPTIPIIITEGAKKAGAIFSCNYVAIALPGINSGYRTPKDEEGDVVGLPFLIPQLQVFASPTRPIYFCFDQDDKRTTRQNVKKAISKTSKLFKKFGSQPWIISWNRKCGKGI
ncbi:MAG: DUF3854 domain-containing protein, partial [Cyanobacteria bacterium P01_A01_bin.80]